MQHKNWNGIHIISTPKWNDEIRSFDNFHISYALRQNKPISILVSKTTILPPVKKSLILRILIYLCMLSLLTLNERPTYVMYSFRSLPEYSNNLLGKRLEFVMFRLSKYNNRSPSRLQPIEFCANGFVFSPCDAFFTYTYVILFVACCFLKNPPKLIAE